MNTDAVRARGAGIDRTWLPVFLAWRRVLGAADQEECAADLPKEAGAAMLATPK